MKQIHLVCILLIVSQITIFAQSKTQIIPQPASIESRNHSYTINNQTSIVADQSNLVNAKYLQNELSEAFQLAVKKRGTEGIILKINSKLSDELGSEGYLIDVNANSVHISAANQTGVFYGIQSLLQLLPSDLSEYKDKLIVPALFIRDYPRFAWRAFMLDEARYFKGMGQVKKILDQMALLKMNVFHWHLTDDQGWRIEIKKYPKLTEVGSTREDTQIGGWNSEKRSGQMHSGFYTQDQIKEIITYAEERQISIIPEIEMPGHASAAIAAYPFLGTIGELDKVPVIFGKLPDSFNVSDPQVLEFLQNVLSEVMTLFPGDIIHIGGDEVKFDAWKESTEVQEYMRKNNLKSPADLQINFTNKVSMYLDKHKHRMMGWNEILGSNVHEWQDDKDYKVEESLAKNTIVHFWKGNLDLITDAVKNGYEIVNSYHVDTYLDYSYKSISLEKAYNFDPIPPGLNPEFHSKVLGSGCQMWGEWIPEVADMDRMVFPRLAAYAEIGWTMKNRKDFEFFEKNLNWILKRWDKLGIDYYK